MKSMGYTLIELLGVIIILALLTTLVFPSVINTIKKSNDKIDENALELVAASADIYIKNNKSLFPKKDGNKFYVDAITLIVNSNLSEKIKLSNGDKIEDKCIQIKYKENKFIYEIKNKGTCVYEKKYICNPVDSDSLTTGNIPTGEFNNGDEYVCEVKDNVFYHFFVIGHENNIVSLIMAQNICIDGTAIDSEEINNCTVAWNTSGSNTNGPVTAINYLNNATKSWTNIPNMDITYNDESGNFAEFNITGKARLPYLREVSAYDSTNKTNTYLYDYLMSGGIQENSINSVSGYWLFATDSASKAHNILFAGDIIVSGVSNTLGVRPVIEFNEGDISNLNSDLES